jgi:Ca2+-binding EF-hand superfamily protein
MKQSFARLTVRWRKKLQARVGRQRRRFYPQALETFMQSKRFITIVATALVLGAAGTAVRAESNDDMSFSGMFKMDRLDKNKDGMVSKAEFMTMMDKVWEMKTKEMKVKGGKMSAEDFNQVLMYLKAGG